MIDIPDGYAAVVVALIGALSVAVGAWVGRRAGRISALEHENVILETSNRRLWFVLRGVVDTLYRHGIPIPDDLEAVINPKEKP